MAADALPEFSIGGLEIPLNVVAPRATLTTSYSGTRKAPINPRFRLGVKRCERYRSELPRPQSARSSERRLL